MLFLHFRRMHLKVHKVKWGPWEVIGYFGGGALWEVLKSPEHVHEKYVASFAHLVTCSLPHEKSFLLSHAL